MKAYKDTAFSSYHPIVSFSYFVIMIVATMLFIHPIFICISLMSSVIYATIINENDAKNVFIFGCFTAITVVVANLLFVHRGSTVLFYLKDNPITFESFMYGVCSGAMMLAVVLWFYVYNEIITSEKFLYIFGKIIPSIALMVSMTIRLIPKLTKQCKAIINAQKTTGLDCTSGSLIKRAKSSMRVLSILVTWALEDAVQTADSMKARGYGLKGRTNFSLFIFKKRDFVMLSFIALMAVTLSVGYLNGFSTFRFYPTLAKIPFDLQSIVIYSGFLVLGVMPSILEVVEGLRWKSLK